MKDLLSHPWLLGAAIALLSFAAIYGVHRLIITRLARLFGKKGNKWDDIIVHGLQHTTTLFMVALSLYIAFRLVPHDKKYNLYVNRTFFVIGMLQLTIWMNFIVNRWVISFINKKVRKNPAAASSISLVQLLAKILLFSIIILFTLHNLGINITTILAGLGVGGIAVALALQRILGDLFSSLSIVMDKPFVVGDFVVVDQFMGEVEHIGLRTTRIRSLTGEQIVMSNSDILASRLRNYNRLHERRVSMVFGLPFTSTPDEIRTAVAHISAIVRSRDRIRFERCHLKSISLNGHIEIEAVYFVLSDDHDLHMDIQQSILLDVLSVLRAEGLTFAYPVRQMHLEPREFFQRSSGEGTREEATRKPRSMS